MEGGRWKVEGGRWKVEGGRFDKHRIHKPDVVYTPPRLTGGEPWSEKGGVAHDGFRRPVAGWSGRRFPCRIRNPSDRSAIVYTLIECCRRRGIDPFGPSVTGEQTSAVKGGLVYRLGLSALPTAGK